MKPFGELGRRAFLMLGAAVVACAGSMRAVLQLLLEPVPDAGLGLVFKHRQSAIAIGRHYLSRYPDDALMQAFAQDLRRAGGGDPAAARLALRARVREDFERGDTVLLDGWILARSECRACAALALGASSAA